ncbi:hypothetical protein F5972_01920 [Microbispora cellulosiformans]|uniref:Hint domain-containing protein n=1 Tax=Microbispora cellulosiformans TaxID=2614688 RepID=A0A5J5K9F5_9ACTN|nr:polymorphic toxin-type HINT domain-containing protein [Microbispora cellulosiformans]KAA9381611.1 hypothetical protein F5972_01920 [Microbispora cellulosiformans]
MIGKPVVPLSRRWTTRLAAPVAAAVLLGLFQVPRAAQAAPDGPHRPGDVSSVSGSTGSARPAGKDPEAGTAWRAREAAWPNPGTATVRPSGDGRARAGDLPVSVGVPADQAGGTGTGTLAVQMLDRKAAAGLGVDGVVVRVARTDQQAAGRADLEVDYSSFADAYGGDWAARLRLVQLPACALTTPGAPACRTATPVPSENRDGKVSAVVQAAPAAGSVYALTAAPSGGSGDFTASSLSPSATWSGGGSTGEFSWSYPLRTPPGLGGPMPQLALSYSSGSVDGRTSSTNNQTSWIGEGWDLTSGGFVERRYKSCADDGVTPKTGDQCWAYDNATVTLGGKASELIRDDATGVWRMKNDDAAKVEKLTGAANGDDDGEHWKITTTDGTQYFFGLARLPGWASGKPETDSTWTVPVFGDDSGEPCHGSTYAASWCRQAWRWNLDYVVDPNGNAATYWYAKETNYYARNLATATSYDRGGYLSRIDYAQRSDSLFSASAPARVTFGVAERCLPDSSFDCATSKFTTANASHWPDVPMDQNCDSGQSCTGKVSPTFWSRKRLTSVTTQIWSGSAYADVDTWTLTHLFPGAGDGTDPALWLDSVQQTGKTGGSAALPAVTFGGAQMHNRVDGTEGLPPFTKRRITVVSNETGGQISVTYSGEECKAGQTPAPDNNTKRCFPQYWTPEGASDPIKDWFHKYVVTEVSEIDRTGGAPFTTTGYEYVGPAAWHYDDDDGLTKEKYKTWSQWRGYQKVRVYEGDPDGERSLTEYLYFRGMDGDRTTSGTRSVSVTDSEGTASTDDDWLQGVVREVTTYTRAGGTVLEGAISDPWTRGPTATRVRSWGTSRAYMVDTARTRTRTALTAGGWRRTESATAFDNDALATQVNDLGDTSTADDDQCVRNTYARNDSKWIIDTLARVETVSVACSVTPDRSKDLLSDARMSYDGGAYGAAPTKGDVTTTEKLAGYDGSPSYVTVATTKYDAYGRVVEVADAAQHKTTTAYTPASGGLVTKTTVTNPAGHVTTTEIRPEWGATTGVVDPNGKRTDVTYDALGRTSQVWLPTRPKASNSASPSAKYAYLVRTDKPVAVTTQTIRNDGTYTTGHTLFDGLLRVRQTQAPAPGGGRVITDTYYNSRGQAVKANQPYFNDQSPATTLWEVGNDADIPGQTRTQYDGAGRPTASVFLVHNVEKWRTTTAYGGDHVDLTPPAGGTATTTYTDARGRTTELRQYKGGVPSGAYDATRYAYTPGGQLAKVTDPAGNQWSYGYDPRGRKVRADDPDKGRTTFAYDDLDQLTSSTDARGRTLAYTYDVLGRPTGRYDGSPTGTKLADWTYDTLANGTSVKGLPVASTRYAGGQAYTTRVDTYDDAYRATSTTMVVPAAEGKLAGSYQYGASYNVDGTLSGSAIPAAGGMLREVMLYGYDELGNPVTTSGLTSYVTDTKYSKLSQPLWQTLRTSSTGKRVMRYFYFDDGTNRLNRVLTQRETAPIGISDLNYGYDEAGNITSIADKPSGQTPDVQCFTYDYLRRLTEAWAQGAEDCAAAPSTSVLGGPAPYWSSFGYDATGNRTREVRHSGSGDVTRTSTFPAAGQPQPHTLRTVATAGGPNDGQSDSYGYDAAGNTTGRTAGAVQQALEWDAEGHLAKVTEAGKTTSYLYDADGNRLIRRDPTGATLYLPGQEVRLDTASQATSYTRYYNHGGAQVAVRTKAGLSWLAPDPQGTATAAVDASTQAVTLRRFDPFGQARGTAPTAWPGEKGFVGGTIDASTGLTHLGAREYDAAAGRFLSVDPLIDVADPQQMNGYGYANNSPVTSSDPDGLIPEDYANGRNGGYRGWQQDIAAAKAHRPIRPHPSYRPVGHYSATPVYHAPKPTCGTWNFGCHIRKAVSTAGQWVAEHKTVIVSTIVAVGVGVACEAVTAGAGTVGCAMLAGAAAHLVSDAMQDSIHSVGDALRSAAIGSLEGLAGAGIGRAIGAAAKAAAPSIRAAVGGRAGRVTAAAEGRSAPAACNSFVPGTAVLLADGSTKPIEDVQVGDRVKSTDPETGETGARPVTALIHGYGDKHLVRIAVADGTKTGTVTATDGHPFWIPGRHAWVDAKNLKPGMWLRTSAGTLVQITAVKKWTAHHQHAHNLTIADLHTYYVAVGNTPVLVHNCNSAVESASVDDLVSMATQQGKGGLSPAGRSYQKHVDPLKRTPAHIAKYDVGPISTNADRTLIGDYHVEDIMTNPGVVESVNHSATAHYGGITRDFRLPGDGRGVRWSMRGGGATFEGFL